MMAKSILSCPDLRLLIMYYVESPAASAALTRIDDQDYDDSIQH